MGKYGKFSLSNVVSFWFMKDNNVYPKPSILPLQGQGAPETGPLPGAPSRDFHMNIQVRRTKFMTQVTCSLTKCGTIPWN